MTPFPEPAESNDFLAEHVTRLRDSYRHWTGRELISAHQTPRETARALFFAPFAVLSHDTAPDPIFNYANRVALELFDMNWEQLTSTPSRRSAEPDNREQRARLLAQVSENGFIEDYRGVRIARSGRRFRIEQATVWNLLTDRGEQYGQAACFGQWITLE